MNDILRIIISLSISGSFMALLLLIGKPVFTKHLSKSCYYYIWFLVLFRLVIPFSVNQSIMNQIFNNVSYPYTNSVKIINNTIEQGNLEHITNSKNGDDIIKLDKSQQNIIENNQMNTPIKNNEKRSIQLIITMFWLSGTCVTLLLCVIPYIHFKLRINNTNTYPDSEDLAVFQNLYSNNKIDLKYNSFIETPMLIGIMSPCIVLPKGYYVKSGRKQELENILYHELIHYKRKDLIYKWFTVIITSFHWFNPLMILIRHHISSSCELSCDEAVIKNMSAIQKQNYGETLLSMAARKKHSASILATTLCEERKELEERLIGIMNYKKQTFGMLLLSVVMVVLLAGCGTILGSAVNGGGDKPDIIPSPEIDKNHIDIEKVEGVIGDNINSVFVGKIGSQNIRMAIYRKGGLLTASYIMQNDEDIEINLQGTIQTNNASFVLNNENGEATFIGIINPDTSNGDLLEGTYTSSVIGEDTEFSLTLLQTIGNTYETRYPLSSSNTKDIEEFASKIKLYITEINKTGLAEIITYPIRVTINGSNVSISNKEEFVKKYDAIINDKFVEKIKNCYTKYLFSNYEGIMLGDGEIWFGNINNSELRIFAINN